MYMYSLISDFLYLYIYVVRTRELILPPCYVMLCRLRPIIEKGGGSKKMYLYAKSII